MKLSKKLSQTFSKFATSVTLMCWQTQQICQIVTTSMEKPLELILFYN